jgi:hypothetical protein
MKLISKKQNKTESTNGGFEAAAIMVINPPLLLL